MCVLCFFYIVNSIIIEGDNSRASPPLVNDV